MNRLAKFMLCVSVLSFFMGSYALGASESFENLIHSRHSGRTYDSSKSLSREQIDRLIEAARYSPSCYNDQPWNFIICDKTTHPEAYQKAFNTLVEFNQGWAKNAPVLVIIVAGSTFAKNQKPNRWGQYDAGAAAMSMMYAAESLGLMTHQMGGFDEAKIQKEFNIPEGYIPMAVMSVGYEAENAQDKNTPKERKPVDANFFFGNWGISK